MHDELIKKLEDFKKELVSEIIDLYKKDDSVKAESLFKRWNKRFKSYLSSINKNELENYLAETEPEIGGFIFGREESEYDIFMGHTGNKVIAFIEALKIEIINERYMPQIDTLPIKASMPTAKSETVKLEIHEKLNQNMRNYINKDPDITTIFIDIVQFSLSRHSERIAKIEILNCIVKSSITNNDFSTEEGLILIPTGDGMAISIKTNNADFAIDLASKIKKEAVNNELAVRIGINKAQDTIVQDINSNVNLCGPGIIGAQRIMDSCPPGNILVSESVHASIADRKGRQHFKKLEGIQDKHGFSWPCYLYLK